MTCTPFVEELREVLGAKLTAYIAGRKSTSMANLTLGEIRRLRFSRRINRLMLNGEYAWDPVTLRTWWMGRNPHLGDESPAQHVRDGDLDTVWQAAQHDYIS
jgi:hypothetical protein